MKAPTPHLSRLLHLDPSTAPRKFAASVPVIERVLWRSRVTESGCWDYAGSLDGNGYGIIRRLGVCIRTHQATYEALVGPKPDGLHIDHLCRRKACCNPEHLEPVTVRVNVFERSFWPSGYPRLTHCPLGHEMTEENTYHRPDGNGRQCRACIRRRAVEHLPKLRAATAQRQMERGNVCKNGHEMTEENTYHVPGKSWKTCRTCRKIASLARSKTHRSES